MTKKEELVTEMNQWPEITMISIFMKAHCKSGVIQELAIIEPPILAILKKYKLIADNNRLTQKGEMVSEIVLEQKH